MRCSRVRKLIDDHVSGLLPVRRNEQVRAHVDSCTTCGDEAQAVRAVTEALPAYGDVPVPIGVFDRILERIETLPPDAFQPAPTPPALRVLRTGARWAAASGLAAAAVLAAASTVENVSERADSRKRGASVAQTELLFQPPATAGIHMTMLPSAGRAGALKSGERVAERINLITPESDFRDGVLRATPAGAPAGAGVSPFELGILGNGAR